LPASATSRSFFFSFDMAFTGAGGSAGLEIWRIENFEAVKLPKALGNFYTGDSYIILSSAQKGYSSSLNYTIYFWIGAESSQDEYGSVAHKTTELGDFLGGSAVHNRECQGAESPSFLSLFKNTGGVCVMSGGVASGFHHFDAEAEYKTRLIHVKGRRGERVEEVSLAAASLNTGDAFVLDSVNKLFVWNGASVNKYEKLKALQLATSIQESNPKAALVLMEDENDPAFWELLGVSTDFVVSSPGQSDARVVAQSPVIAMYTLDSEDGAFVKCKEVDRTNLKSDSMALVSSTNFSGSPIVHLWKGSNGSRELKAAGAAKAAQFLQKAGLPKDTAMQFVAEGLESSQFRSLFPQWSPPIAPKQWTSKERKPDTPMSDDEIESILHMVQNKEAPVDNGDGVLQIWRIEDFKKVPIDPDMYGTFYGGDSYIVLYGYRAGGKDQSIIYFWQGKQSTADEKGTSAILTKELDDSLGGRPVQVRVCQGKEPAHFCQLFKGKMVVFSGGRASGFNNLGEEDTSLDDEVLLQVRGSKAENTHAVQVEKSASELSSADTFVLLTPSTAQVWRGRGATDAEVSTAEALCSSLAQSYQNKDGRAESSFAEGDEPEDFWAALGGRAEYSAISQAESMREPRLFHASTATGKFHIEEIPDFDQSDLIDEDVMILDAGYQVFVWIGSQATTEEREKAVDFTQRYLALDDSGREQVPVATVPAGCEPKLFTCHFHAWDHHASSIFADPYEAKLAAIRSAKAAKQESQEETEKSLARMKVIEEEERKVEARRASLTPPGKGFMDEAEVEERRQRALAAAQALEDEKAAAAAAAEANEPPVAPLYANALSPTPEGRRSISKPPAAAPMDTTPRARRLSADGTAKFATPVADVHKNLTPKGVYEVPKVAYAEPGSKPISLADLVGAFPEGIDPTKKEAYLSDSEFNSAFGMDKASFSKLPKWKRDAKKKELGLF
jgi:villin 1/advillin